jgi:C4-dicarboxylate-specific signal transduction histidine kinase
VRSADGRIIGVVNAKSNPDVLQKVLDAERQRIGDDARGVLIDEQGLVIASNIDPTWLLRPVVPVKADVAEAMKRDKRWGTNPMPEPLGEADLAQVIGTSRPFDFAWRTGGFDYHAVAFPLQQTNWTYSDCCWPQ